MKKKKSNQFRIQVKSGRIRNPDEEDGSGGFWEPHVKKPWLLTKLDIENCADISWRLG